MRVSGKGFVTKGRRGSSKQVARSRSIGIGKGVAKRSRVSSERVMTSRRGRVHGKQVTMSQRGIGTIGFTKS